jgi:hypothetical protein
MAGGFRDVPALPRIFGGNSEEDPPVPIPNTEVKLLSADGTARVTVWESRSPPILLRSQPAPGYRLLRAVLFLA